MTHDRARNNGESIKFKSIFEEELIYDREIIVSDKPTLSFPLPTNYLNKELEIIIFSLDEKVNLEKKEKSSWPSEGDV
jgi:hypothetical protein